MSGSARLAVTGNPVAHSKSPQIFRKFFELKGIDGFYSRIAADSIGEAIETARIAGITGLNVTSPFKEKAASEAIRKEDAVRVLSAANTLLIEGDGVVSAYNTDYLGVIASVTGIYAEGYGKKAFVLGAGGAGIAAAYGLSLAGFDVTVFNRTLEKAAERVKGIAGCRAGRLEMIDSLAGEADLIVNALPVTEAVIDLSLVRKDAVVFDANYRNSPLADAASLNSLRFISGLTWLIKQAEYSFRIFTGMDTDNGFAKVVTEKDLETSGKSNISLIGFMGSGKTSTGKYLAEMLKTGFTDIDMEIEKSEGMSITEIFNSRGEGYFRQAEKRMTEKVLTAAKGQVISCGGGSVKDKENRCLIAEHSFPVWLASPPEISAGRIRDSSRPLLNTEKKIEEALKIFRERIDFYGMTSSLIINSAKRGALETAGKINEEISFFFRNQG